MWDHPLTIQAPTQCVSCHFLAHTTHYTFQPNKGQCSGTALRALYQEALCITATYVSHDTTVPATATVTAVQWAQPPQRGKTPNELPAEIPIIVLARKSHHSGPGPNTPEHHQPGTPPYGTSQWRHSGAPASTTHTPLWRTNTGRTPSE